MKSKLNQVVHAFGKVSEIISLSGIMIGLILLQGCQEAVLTNVESAEEHPNITKLRAQSAEFTPEIIKLNESVYVAVGYDGSNASMVIGDEGVVIIDALRALGAAEKVAEQFRGITNKPVEAVIYTHGHEDHTGGASAFIGESKDVRIIAREGFKEELQENSPVEQILRQRNARQFGRDLPSEVIINRGVGPGSSSSDRVGEGFMVPNYLFQDSTILTIAGLDFELYAADGETNDELFVWIPDLQTLFAGDNYYKSFPNLYAIRGSQYRDVKSWGEAIHKMSTFPVEYLVPGHTRPLSGSTVVHRNLENYSAAILSVYEQTIEAMNRGYSLQQTVDRVRLSDELANQPNLQEFYGSVPWGVRSIFLHYVGWFDGNPTNLSPLSSADEAKKMIQLAGGSRNILKHLSNAMNVGDYQWGLQLVDYLIQADDHYQEAVDAKIRALRGLAKEQINAPARNYYLSYAYELEQNKVDK